MKVVVATFNKEKALVGTFSVITNLCVDLRSKFYTDLGLCFSACLARPGSGQPSAPAVSTSYVLERDLRSTSGVVGLGLASQLGGGCRGLADWNSDLKLKQPVVAGAW